MSLTDVKTLKGVQIDITPNGGSTTSRQYIAETIRAQLVRTGQGWQTSDGRNHRNLKWRHIRFTLEGALIEQVSNTGNTRHPIEISEDLSDTSGYTVELYPDADQSKKFEVVIDDIEQDMVLVEFDQLVRSETESIRAITRDPVSRADVEWFKRY